MRTPIATLYLFHAYTPPPPENRKKRCQKTGELLKCRVLGIFSNFRLIWSYFSGEAQPAFFRYFWAIFELFSYFSASFFLFSGGGQNQKFSYFFLLQVNKWEGHSRMGICDEMVMTSALLLACNKHFKVESPWTSYSTGDMSWTCEAPAPTGVSWARRVCRGVSPWVSPKTGVSNGVSHGVFLGRFGPRSPKSVQKVSRECPQSVRTPYLCTKFGFFSIEALLVASAFISIFLVFFLMDNEKYSLPLARIIFWSFFMAPLLGRIYLDFSLFFHLNFWH